MITLIEPCDKREPNKSNKRQHQKPEKEDLQFFDEELLFGNDNSLSSEEEELNPDCNINDRTFSEQKLKPECTHNLSGDVKESILRENIRA